MIYENLKGTRSSNGNRSSIGNGIMGSGIFGMLGTTVQCKDSDNSYYCNFMKLIQICVYLFIILFIIYFVTRQFKR